MPQDHDHPPDMSTSHLVKGEDLNHHHTLYAGRCVEWCVHAAYLTAANCFPDHRAVVLMSIRSLSLRAAARLGDIVEIIGRVDYVGESTIGVRVHARQLQPRDQRKVVATGTFLFCTVDERGRAQPHGLPLLAPTSPSARNHWQRAGEDD